MVQGWIDNESKPDVNCPPAACPLLADFDIIAEICLTTHGRATKEFGPIIDLFLDQQANQHFYK